MLGPSLRMQKKLEYPPWGLEYLADSEIGRQNYFISMENPRFSENQEN